MRKQYRIVVNTGALYVKMLLSLFVTFYSTRIILQNLGVNDFGIYNLVASSISLLGFVNGSMSNTAQRFLAFELGHGVLDRLKKVFAISLSAHFWIGIGLVIALELLGTVAFDHIFVIEANRVESAKIAYQLMIWVAFFSTLTSPFSASIFAHEHIFLFAIADFTAALLKLLAAVMLCFFDSDKLVLYSCFMLFIQFVHFMFEAVYCHIKYEECRTVDILHTDKKLKKEVFPFLGWNMMESCSWLAKSQGIAILMNTFYGTVVNAAYGIAGQVQGQVMYFSSSMLGAVRPQIYKAGGAGNNAQVLSLSASASKFAVFLMLLFLAPLSFVLNEILSLWLTTVPPYTTGICLLLISITLINYLSIGVGIAVQASGKVKIFQIVVSIVTLVVIPIGYFLYSNSTNVYLLLYVMVALEVILTILKYKMAADIFCVTIWHFLKSILIPCIFTLILSFGMSLFIYKLVLTEGTLFRYALFILIDVLAVALTIYYVGLSGRERCLIGDMAKGLRNKLFKR